MKKKCAIAALNMIKDGMTVGFGGGSTVALLIEEVKNSGMKVTAVTPSMDTKELLVQAGIPVLSTDSVSAVDVAFDGCDEVDESLHALKSCGGIHTREKLIACMAEDYVLLADESKFFTKLPFAYPVCVEVIPSATAYVKARLEALGAEVTLRRCANKTGLTVTDDGNYLMDAKFDGAKVTDPQALNNALDSTPGILGHSLFYGVASKAIIAGKDDIRVVTK